MERRALCRTCSLARSDTSSGCPSCFKAFQAGAQVRQVRRKRFESDGHGGQGVEQRGGWRTVERTDAEIGL
jgi:hypothetical protein